ncbi:phage major capsid protein [Pararhodobacter oceanensis]|uniref:Phage major capsid protein n=2 Tax=Pararhodobacter oceanensis TaxID=2172121 RepID=A0A2T8HW77_9RHOB|nr:phage major capsid protein [Pararhodobacter oceanensis]PVH29602.1 phage major capsid protein [Pararhodobacter oceanensis]
MSSEIPGFGPDQGAARGVNAAPATPPATAPAVGAAPEAAHLKQAMDGFVHEIKSFRADVIGNLKQQDERLTMMDRKFTTKSSRPLLAQGDAGEGLHLKAFDAYLRSGDDDALRGIMLEGKGMTTTVNSEGGYLVDPQTSERIQGVLYAAASVRAIASVVQVEAGSFDVLVDHGDVGSGWATESTAVTETGTGAIDRISIRLHELSAMPKASQRLLEDSAFDVEGWLAERIAQKFARAEAAAFISGDGADKPRGILDHEILPEGSEVWGQLGYVATGTAGDFDAVNPADAVVDLVYALDAGYRANAGFVMNSKTAGAVRKMKDGDGRFLWSDGLAAGEPARLMGYPVLIAEDMPDIAAGAHAIAFGDFQAGYTIAERPDLRVLRDPFSAKPHVLFYATKRVGGDVTDFKAIKLLKFAVS